MVLGMTMRAVAIMRPMSQMVGALFSSIGVPSTATARESGWFRRQNREVRLRSAPFSESAHACIRHSCTRARTHSPRALMGTDSGCSGSVDSE